MADAQIATLRGHADPEDVVDALVDKSPTTNAYLFQKSRVIYTMRRPQFDVILTVRDREIQIATSPLRPSYYLDEILRLCRVLHDKLELSYVPAAVETRWRAARETARAAAIKRKKLVPVVDETALALFVEHDRRYERLHAKHGPDGALIPDTFLLRRRGNRRVWTAATCPKPTFCVFPPVELFVLFANPLFRFGGAKAGLERAPVIPATTLTDRLRPWLVAERTGAPGTKVLTERAILTEDAAFAAFSKVWEETTKAPILRFRDFTIVDHEDLLDEPLE